MITETVPFNFDELHTSLSTKFSDAGFDIAPGSNVSQLVTAMAYLTSMLNVNTAVNINETILSLSTTRKNALTDARALGYEIQHKQSYAYRLSLTLAGSPTGTYTIPKYTRFVQSGISYYYMGAQIELTGQPDNRVLEILVVQGELFKFSDYPKTLSYTTTSVLNESGQTVPQFYVDLPFVDIEENGIEMYITYYDDYGSLVTNEKWLKADQFMIDKDLVVSNKFFRMDDIDYRTPRIYFELAGVGSGVKLGSTVNFNVLKSDGVAGVIPDINDLVGIKHVLNNITVSAIKVITEGADEETIQSVKANAPKFYNSANRAVTANDYQAICNRQASIRDSKIWGGEDELPKCPGHIWFSFLPSTLQRQFTADAFNNHFLLDNYTFVDWDYTLQESADPVNAPGPFEAQLAAGDIFYSLRFLEDTEIKSTEYNSSGNPIQPGIWDILDNFKIPTLEFHNRHPIYLDYEYDLEILKYDVVTSKSDINKGVFDTIDGFFNGVGNTKKAESFNSEYFHSSLEKRVDIFLSDTTGFNNTITTKLLLTQKNVVRENFLKDFRDIYIPLKTPFESYFDIDGFLLFDMLPSIDTPGFVDVRTLQDIADNINPPRSNLFVDWSEIKAEIAAGTPQKNKEVIIVPIRIFTEESYTNVGPAIGAISQVTLKTMGIYPDDPATLDVGVPTYNKTTVFKIDGTTGIETILLKDDTLGYTIQDPLNPNVINLGIGLQETDTLRVECLAACGSYILFNSFKKYITVQLHVDAQSYLKSQAEQITYDSPKSYLTTLEELYDRTNDTFYLTTKGYSLTSVDQVNVLTGAIVKSITPHSYLGSPIKMTLFRRDRYLNLNYNSPNFSVMKNVMPRLKRVTFK